MKTLITLTTLLLLSGCGSYGLVKKAAAEDGAQAADEALIAAEWYFCTAATVGAVKRRYQTEEDRAAYNTICGDQLP